MASGDVEFECAVSAVGKMRNELLVRMLQPRSEQHEFATDEGIFHGGDATAPQPVVFFVGSLAACFTTQVRAFAKRKRLDLEDVKVNVLGSWRWESTGVVYEAEWLGFRIDVEIVSSESEEVLAALIADARKGCFVEQSLSDRRPIMHRLKTETGWVEIN